MIDSHCHLAGEEFEDDLDLVITRAREAGVQGALCILDAGNRVEIGRVPTLRARWTALRFSAGVHPHRAGQCGTPGEVEHLVRQVVAETGACAIGEVGLDYHYDFAPRQVQQAVFARQVALACHLDLPLVIHTREADEDTLAVLREAGEGRARGVLHCFTGDAALAASAIALGFHVSFSGIVTFPRADALRAVAAGLPHDRVLIETDSPFLAPVPFRGRRNEPAWVGRIAETLAAVWHRPVDEVVRQTTATFDALFGVASPRTAHDGSR